MEREKDIAIKITALKKRYRLGTIGGGTLRGDLQSWWARIRKKEDPNSKIGAKTYEKNETFMALDGIDLTVYKGERLGIIGHNGAGKSTLLKLLSRVTGPTEGEICLDGRISSMLEVGTGFNPELTGRENVYLNGAILGMTKAEIDGKIEKIIDFSEVRQFIDTPVKRYSSGMYVKLAFAVASHLDSEILIMDEVLAVGDMAFQKKCLDKMSQVSQDEGRTILYVSHNMNTIRQLCDRCIVMDKGKIIFNGDVEEAIGIYLNVFQYENDVDIDLSKKRMAHLPQNIDAKITRVVLTDKEIPLYDFNEDLGFSLTIKSNKHIENACVRLEVKRFDDIPVGIAVNQNIGIINKGEEKTLYFNLNGCNIIPGKYKVLLVLYEISNTGTYDDLDAVYPAFIYRIIDDKNQIKIKWNKYNWGNILLGELENKKLGIQ